MAHKKEEHKKHERMGHGVHELVHGHGPQHDKKAAHGSHKPKAKHHKAK